MPDHIEIKIPSLGESVSEATIAKWNKADGDYVKVDEVLAELETDKATVELPATKAGTLKLVAQKGATVRVGDTVAKIDTAGKPGKVTPVSSPAGPGAPP